MKFNIHLEWVRDEPVDPAEDLGAILGLRARIDKPSGEELCTIELDTTPQLMDDTSIKADLQKRMAAKLHEFAAKQLA